MIGLNPGDHLTCDFVKLVEQFAAALGEAAAGLVDQADKAIVVSYSPTMLNIDIPPDAPLVEMKDGPLPVQAIVHDAKGVVGEVLLWIRSGRLIGFEQTWYTDQPPTEWPSLSSVEMK